MAALREKIATEISGWDYERDEDAKFVADRIVEIVKQAQPVLTDVLDGLLEEISVEFAAELALSPDGKEQCPDGENPFRWKAQRVLDLVEPLFGTRQPKLEWREGGGYLSELKLNDLTVGCVTPSWGNHGKWDGFLRFGVMDSKPSEQEARAAVEDAVRKALGWGS